jgi:hypothetical protein
VGVGGGGGQKHQGKGEDMGTHRRGGGGKAGGKGAEGGIRANAYTHVPRCLFVAVI